MPAWEAWETMQASLPSLVSETDDRAGDLTVSDPPGFSVPKSRTVLERLSGTDQIHDFRVGRECHGSWCLQCPPGLQTCGRLFVGAGRCRFDLGLSDGGSVDVRPEAAFRSPRSLFPRTSTRCRR